MKKKTLSLYSCGICGRPVVLYEMVSTAKMSSNDPPSVGPKTHPWVKSWCNGYCEGITIPLVLEIDSLLTFAAKTKRKTLRKFARLVAKRLGKIRKEQAKSIRDMVDAQ